MPSPNPEIIIYQTEDGRTRIQCQFEEETLWLTQMQIAELFEVTVSNINIHLKAIYDDGELGEGATVKPCLIVRNEGGRQVSRPVLHYSLPAILAVGFRVRSLRGTQFRQRAMQVLHEDSRLGRARPLGALSAEISRIGGLGDIAPPKVNPRGASIGAHPQFKNGLRNQEPPP